MIFFSKKQEPPPVAAVIDACGDDLPFATLGGLPVLARCLDALESCPRVTGIVIVCLQRHMAGCFDLARDFGFGRVGSVVAAEGSWQESMRAAINACREDAKLFLFHEAARPLVSPGEIDACLEAASASGAAVSAVPTKDTLKLCDENGVVISSPRRDRFFSAQFPQAFEAEPYRRAMALAFSQNRVFSDHCSLVENAGIKIAVAAGSYENIKIETPEEFVLAEAILRMREEGVAFWQAIE